MVKNNLLALLIHLIISILSFAALIVLNSTGLKWASEEAFKRHHNNMVLASIIMIVVAFILFCILGRIYLTYQGNMLKNILAASLPAIVGILLWAIAIITQFTSNDPHILNPIHWQYYAMYNSYCILFLDECKINNSFIFLLFTILPSIIFAIGMQSRQIWKPHKYEELNKI